MRVDTESTQEVRQRLQGLLHDAELLNSRVLLLASTEPWRQRAQKGGWVVHPFLISIGLSLSIRGINEMLESLPAPIPAPEQEPDEDEEYEDFGDIDNDLYDEDDDYNDEDEDYDDEDDTDIDDSPCADCESTTCLDSPAYKRPAAGLWEIL